MSTLCPPVLVRTIVPGEIIRSELGGHDTATLVSLKPRERLIGESAVAMVTSNPKGTISAAHTMVGTPYR